MHQVRELQEPAYLRRVQRTPSQRRARIVDAVQHLGMPPDDELQLQRLRRTDPTLLFQLQQ